MTAEAQRFLSRTKAMPSGCIEWNGAKNRAGYGDFNRKIDGKWKTCKAHRYAWEMTHGEAPEDRHVLHKCDNPACVNPEHLFLGTHQDNMRDRLEKRRFPVGESHRNSVLTTEQVREIRSSAMNAGRIAKVFCVSKVTVNKIRRGAAWRDIA